MENLLVLNTIYRFLESYANHNISFWGLTTQNEPTDGLVKDFQFNAIGWTPQEQVHKLRTNGLHWMLCEDCFVFLIIGI